MASVSLPPRNAKEWLQAYYILPKNDSKKILDLCSEMEKELGQVTVAEDVGKLGALIAKFTTVSFRDEDENFHISEGKHQEFANLYREFERRFYKLEQQSIRLDQLLGKNENLAEGILNKRNLLTRRMDEHRKARTEFLNLFRTLNFSPYNRIFQAFANVFIFSPLKQASSILKTKKIETLALGSFILIGGYSFITKTHYSFIVNSIPYIISVYVGHVISKTLRPNDKEPEPQTFSITVSPPTSPRK